MISQIYDPVPLHIELQGGSGTLTYYPSIHTVFSWLEISIAKQPKLKREELTIRHGFESFWYLHGTYPSQGA